MHAVPRGVPVSLSKEPRVTKYGFASRYKLLKTDEFSSVFSFKQRIFGERLALHVLPNTLGFPRLGIVVSKKTSRRAVDRNYMRRIIREWFRLHRSMMSGHDMVVRVNKPFARSEAELARKELARFLEKRLMRVDREPENYHDQTVDLAD